MEQREQHVSSSAEAARQQLEDAAQRQAHVQASIVRAQREREAATTATEQLQSREQLVKELQAAVAQQQASISEDVKTKTRALEQVRLLCAWLCRLACVCQTSKLMCMPLLPCICHTHVQGLESVIAREQSVTKRAATLDDREASIQSRETELTNREAKANQAASQAQVRCLVCHVLFPSSLTCVATGPRHRRWHPRLLQLSKRPRQH